MRFVLAFAVLAAFGSTAAAAPAALEGAIVACAAKPEAAARLACYDALAAGLKSGAVAETPVAPPATAATEFGAEKVAAAPGSAEEAAEEIDEIKAVVTEVTRGPTGRFIVTLDNGQVWRQVEGDKKPSRAKPGNAIVISRGFLSSYNMTIEGINLLYKVVRVR